MQEQPNGSEYHRQGRLGCRGRGLFIEHSELPGLHIEADTPIALYEKLPGAIEDLLEGSGTREVTFEFIAPGHVKIAA